MESAAGEPAHVHLDRLQREKELLLQELAVDIDQISLKLKLVNGNISKLLQSHAQLDDKLKLSTRGDT